MPEVVRSFLKTGDKSLRAAAWAADRDATGDYESLRAAAWTAARDAAWAAERAAARAAAWAAERAAARAAERAAAWTAAWDAARATARDAQNEKLREMVEAEWMSQWGLKEE
jgi:hypothetical protein